MFDIGEEVYYGDTIGIVVDDNEFGTYSVKLDSGEIVEAFEDELS